MASPQSRPRFYRNLQSLKEKGMSSISVLKPIASSVNLSIRSSTQSLDLTRSMSQQSHSHSHSRSHSHSPERNGSQSRTPLRAKQSTSHLRSATTTTLLSYTSTTSRTSTPTPAHSSSPPTSIPPPSTSTRIPRTTPRPSSTTPNDLNPTASLLSLATHIQSQTKQARHLFSLPHIKHHLAPSEKTWITSTITDTETATHDVLRLTESFRIDQATNAGRISLRSQLRWWVRDERKAQEMRERLVVCHASLVLVLGRLQWLQDVGREGSEVGLEEGEGSRMRGVDESGEEERKGKVTELQNDVTPIGAVGTPAYATTSGSIRKGRRSSAWDLSVELQDAGMEVVVPGSGPQLEKEKEMKLEKRLKPEPLTAGSTNNSVVKLPPQREEEVESTKLDNELLDMLSWRWAQGRQTQA